MSDSRYIFLGSLVHMAGMGLRTALSPLALLLPHFFPPRIFGMFVSLRALINVCRQLFSLDFKRGLAWWIPRQHAEGGGSSQAAWNAIRFIIAFGAAGALLLGALLRLFDSQMPEDLRHIPPGLLWICLASIPGMVALDAASGCMDGIRKPKYSALYGNSLSIGLMPVLAILLHLIGIPNGLSWGLFAANWLCAIIILERMRTLFPKEKGEAQYLPERRLLDYSIPSALNNWVSMGLINIDLWLVAWWIGPTEAGIYGVMQMLATGVRKVRQSYDPLIVPVVSRMEPDTLKEKLPEVLTYSTHLVSSLQLGIALFIVCFYREILSISGAQFARFGTAFILLTASNLAGGFSGISSQALLGMGKSSMLLRQNLIISAVALAAGSFLVPMWGMTGAALLALFISVLQTAILFHLQMRLHGGWPYKKGFLVNAAWIGGFVLTSSIAAPWIAEAGLGMRGALFLAAGGALGTWVVIVRSSFLPAEDQDADKKQDR
jgi:O-antigen/teichoic acid export membrane protein